MMLVVGLAVACGALQVGKGLATSSWQPEEASPMPGRDPPPTAHAADADPSFTRRTPLGPARRSSTACWAT